MKESRHISIFLNKILLLVTYVFYGTVRAEMLILPSLEPKPIQLSQGRRHLCKQQNLALFLQIKTSLILKFEHCDRNEGLEFPLNN